jgi:hypothetical protein
MILSRVWFAILAVAVAAALSVAYIAIGEYDRQATRTLADGLASDGNTVESRLESDARHRLDGLVAASTDAALGQALAGSGTSKEGKPSLRSRLAARKALAVVTDAIPLDARNDAVFAVDHDGRVVAEVGYDAVAGNEDFELGGYPAVNDALHGWARDDVWMLGNKMYFVVARPMVSDTADITGALVGLTEVTSKLVGELAKRTGTNLVFYASGEGVAGGVGVDGVDRESLKAIGNDLKNVADQSYGDHGRSPLKMVSEDLGAMYVRLPGDAWALGAGFAIARTKVALGGVFGAMSHAIDKDRANVPWVWLALLALAALAAGVGLTFVEQTVPVRELVRQSERLKTPGTSMELPRLAGTYRVVAENVNGALEQAAKALAAASAAAPSVRVAKAPRAQLPRLAARDGANPPPSSARAQLRSSPGDEAGDLPTMMMAAKADAARGIGPSPSAPSVTPPPSGLISPPAQSAAVLIGPTLASRVAEEKDPSATFHAATPADLLAQSAAMESGAPLSVPLSENGTPLSAKSSTTSPTDRPRERARQNRAPDTTAVRSAPAEVLSLATGENRVPDTTAVVAAPSALLAEATVAPPPVPGEEEWRATFVEFVRLRKECGEATEGLTYERFSAMLKKHRDALLASTKCKQVKFAIGVKDGKASLKATPLH